MGPLNLIFTAKPFIQIPFITAENSVPLYRWRLTILSSGFNNAPHYCTTSKFQQTIVPLSRNRCCTQPPSCNTVSHVHAPSAADGDKPALLRSIARVIDENRRSLEAVRASLMKFSALSEAIETMGSRRWYTIPLEKYFCFFAVFDRSVVRCGLG